MGKMVFVELEDDLQRKVLNGALSEALHLYEAKDRGCEDARRIRFCMQLMNHPIQRHNLNICFNKEDMETIAKAVESYGSHPDKAESCERILELIRSCKDFLRPTKETFPTFGKETLQSKEDGYDR